MAVEHHRRVSTAEDAGELRGPQRIDARAVAMNAPAPARSPKSKPWVRDHRDGGVNRPRLERHAHDVLHHGRRIDRGNVEHSRMIGRRAGREHLHLVGREAAVRHHDDTSVAGTQEDRTPCEAFDRPFNRAAAQIVADANRPVQLEGKPENRLPKSVQRGPIAIVSTAEVASRFVTLKPSRRAR